MPAPPGKTVTRKQDLPFAPDASNYKRLICAINDFKEACLETKLLNIKDKTMHKKAFNIIGGDFYVPSGKQCSIMHKARSSPRCRPKKVI